MHIQQFVKVIALIVGIAAALPAQTAPVVIFDAGDSSTKSIETYMRVLRKPAQFVLPNDPQSRARIQQNIQDRADQHGGYGGVHVPIRTTNMSPQRMASQDAYFPNMSKPLFVVGADSLSIAWLKQWREALLKVGAIGLVVQAENAQELRLVSEAGAGLKFIPMSGDRLPEILGVKGYPLLISQRAIEQ